MGKVLYGARVVGEELAAAHKKERSKKKIRYGSKVVDEAPKKAAASKKKAPPTDAAAQAEAEKAAAAAKAAAVAAEKAAAATTTEPSKQLASGETLGEEAFEALLATHANADGYMSIDALKNALEDAPTAFNRLMSWELGREGGPRIGSLTHLLETETKREGGPRSMILQVLEKAIASVRSTPGA